MPTQLHMPVHPAEAQEDDVLARLHKPAGRKGLDLLLVQCGLVG
jgi:hypothetical protein